MLRLILPVLVLAACDWTEPDTAGPGSRPIPDAYMGCIGAFQIMAPKADLHYAASMDVIVDESELQYELSLTMIDDAGTAYKYTADSSEPNPDGTFWNRDKFHYELAAGHRYDLTVSHCDQSQTVTFFTSP